MKPSFDEDFPPVPLEFYLENLPQAKRVGPLRALQELTGNGCDRARLQVLVERVLEDHDVRQQKRRLRLSPAEKRRLLAVPEWAARPPGSHKRSVIMKSEKELFTYVERATPSLSKRRRWRLLEEVLDTVYKAFPLMVEGYKPNFGRDQLKARYYRRKKRGKAGERPQ